MRPGPARKPTKIKRLEGNPGQYPLNENEPEPTPGCDPPSWLPAGAMAEWRRVYPELDALGLMTRVDQAALVCWCMAVDNLERATLALAPTDENPRPEIQCAPSGYECVSGAELMRRQAMKDIRAFCQEFGFSPAARSRVSVPSKPDDDLEKMLSKNTN